MRTIRNAVLSLGAVFALAACETGTPAPDIAPDAAAGRFFSYFNARCDTPIQAGRAPATKGLIAAAPEIAARYPKVVDYQEFQGRALSFWTGPDDVEGGVIMVIEQGPDSTRCAVATRAFDQAEFADRLRRAYPGLMGEAPDDVAVNARISAASEDTETMSKVYSTYHDPEGRVSALVLSESEESD
ncbi:MAG: hypothetical protein ACK5MQ_09290 [Pikeienuella sp.]